MKVGVALKRIAVNTSSFTPTVTVRPVSESDGTVTGKEWDTIIIQSGKSLNGGMYPKDVLHGFEYCSLRYVGVRYR